MGFLDIELINDNAISQIEDYYDIIIIGGGPAGLSAGIYSSRSGLSTLIIEKAVAGGQVSLTTDVENYPGFTKISGMELSNNFKEHALSAGARIVYSEVINFQLCCNEKKIVLDTKKAINTKAIIITTGASHKKLNVKGEEEYSGKGVSYCAICDGAFFKNKNVAVIGGGNAALDESIYLSSIASKVTIIHRRDQFRGDKVLQERIFNNPKIEVIWDSTVEEFKGDKMLNKIILNNVKTSQKSEIEVDGAFIYVGIQPNTGLFKNIVKLNEYGFIPVNSSTMETSIPGIFAAGDVIDKEIRQTVNAASEGTIAALMAKKLYF